MWSPDRRLLVRSLTAFSLAGLTAGWVRPLYGDPSVVPTAGLDNKLATIVIAPTPAPSATRLAVQVRDKLLFEVTKGGGPTSANKLYRLDIQLAATQNQVIVDIISNRAGIQNYCGDASYTLTELATSKPVFRSTTFARVSYDIPGQQQRFAGDRGLRDAENGAAEVIAENIRNRLASYFVAGT
jgi:LPS-assembly lipoprotein